ncbi:MAG: integrin alpha [Phycisphaerae bacterium]
MASQTGRNESSRVTRDRASFRGGNARAASRVAVLIVAGSILVTGLSLGGCPGSPPVTPVEPGTAGGTNKPSAGTGSGNVQPVLSFLEPVLDQEVSPGDVVAITWTLTDSDDNPQYTIQLDPDSIPNNGNEIVIARGFASDLPPSGQTYLLNTKGLATGTYLVRGTADDGVNPTIQITATGRVRLFPAGLQHRNRPPFILVTEPSSVHGVVQGDVVQFSWCARDPDDNARVLLLLDYDDNPDNDVVFHTKSQVDAICQGTLPRQVNGAILLACSQENDCTDPTQGDTLNWVIDVSDIPPRPDGEPYRVRADITDMTTDNPTLHSYAPGGIMVLPIVSTSVVDVGNVGRTLAGAVFEGFDAGSRLGQAFTRVPDLNNDGADEFVMVAQYGHPFERGPVGSAYLVFGRPLAQPTTQPSTTPLPGSRFAGDIPVNSITTTIDGITFTAPVSVSTEGITNVSYVPDLDGDGKVELLFGMPWVEGMQDGHYDDPCNHGPTGCYPDLLPNPLSDNPPTGGSNDQINAGDMREGQACPEPGTILCSNDQDLGTITPIISGYMIYVSSQNLVSTANPESPTPRNVFVGLGNIGSSVDPGARFRGAWYDFDLSQTEWPYAIVPTTRFGETVASMPALTTGWDDGHGIPNISACWSQYYVNTAGYGNSPAKDTVPEVLTSAPMAREGRGLVVLTFGQDFSTWQASNFNSIPHYFGCDCPSGCYQTRGLSYPGFRLFNGGAIGDHLGYAWAAGDFNLDGNQDILMGAPGASRDGLNGNGILYIVFGRVDIGDIDFAAQNPPRVEIHGVTAGEGLGAVNRLLDDVNGDSLPDIGFGVPNFSPNGLPQAGMVGIIFGGRRLTGENVFNDTQVGTTQLPGVRFLGTQPGGNAGNRIASAGDFNGDGFGDLLIVAPNETRAINGQVRRGVVYLIFGGRHLYNQVFLLSQVGTKQLPGIVFVSPFAAGTADEASLEAAEAAGDVDGDGFGDILIGTPAADYVDPTAPSQRRVDAGKAYLIYGTNRISMIGE